MKQRRAERKRVQRMERGAARLVKLKEEADMSRGIIMACAEEINMMCDVNDSADEDRPKQFKDGPKQEESKTQRLTGIADDDSRASEGEGHSVPFEKRRQQLGLRDQLEIARMRRLP